MLTGPVETSGDITTGFSEKGHFILVLEYLGDFVSLFDYIEDIQDQVEKSLASEELPSPSKARRRSSLKETAKGKAAA